MRFLSLILFLPTFAFSQSFPFQCTFAKMYFGQYSKDQHKTTKLTLTETLSVDVRFDGSSDFVAIYRSKVSSDTLQLSLRLEDVTPGDDFVEYKFIDPNEGFMVFLRYNRYYVPGIRELSIFHPDGNDFFYIKRKISDEEENRWYIDRCCNCRIVDYVHGNININRYIISLWLHIKNLGEKSPRTRIISGWFNKTTFGRQKICLIRF